MSLLPRVGIYKNEDYEITITISSTNASTGIITGIYHANFSPEGPPLETTGTIGNYTWVTNSEGKSGDAPFIISFSASKCPAGRPYCIIEHWNGVYRKDDTMLLTGTSSYVNNKGVAESKLIVATALFTKVS